LRLSAMKGHLLLQLAVDGFADGQNAKFPENALHPIHKRLLIRSIRRAVLPSVKPASPAEPADNPPAPRPRASAAWRPPAMPDRSAQPQTAPAPSGADPPASPPDSRRAAQPGCPPATPRQPAPE